jgi:RNA polymerase sigma-70 factor, ECF subfamily
VNALGYLPTYANAMGDWAWTSGWAFASRKNLHAVSGKSMGALGRSGSDEMKAAPVIATALDEAERSSLLPEDLAMNRYAQGEDDALEVIYDALAPKLYGFVMRRTRDGAQSEDLVQQTFLQMHKARGSFIEGSRVAPWAIVICKRLMLDGMRKQVRTRKHVDEGASQEDVADPREDAESLVFAKQLGQQAAKVLAGLPENQRTAFALIRIDGLSVAEAAELLGTSASAVKLRAHRAYVALEQQLGAAFDLRTATQAQTEGGGQ